MAWWTSYTADQNSFLTWYPSSFSRWTSPPLESVKKAADTVTAQSERLDILMLNAGIMAAPPALTTDGDEVQLAVNYLGHALLAKLLLPLLEKTASLPDADVRIVMLSSDIHTYAPKPAGIQFNTLQTTADELGPYGR
ncbi:hypothetical protein FQN49_007030 [Arthroderma sp. PD_2]|nr:hypothetical protein FQN49_007030 [Arthroderma sp. PD_2]